MKGNKYKNILEKLDINELKLCRNEKELRKYLKTKDINLTRAQVYELKEFYCRKIQNTEVLSLETLDNVAGGILSFHSKEGLVVMPFSHLYEHGKKVLMHDKESNFKGDKHLAFTLSGGNIEKAELKNVDDLVIDGEALHFAKMEELRGHLLTKEGLTDVQADAIIDKSKNINKILAKILVDTQEGIEGNLDIILAEGQGNLGKNLEQIIRENKLSNTEPLRPLDKPTQEVTLSRPSTPVQEELIDPQIITRSMSAPPEAIQVIEHETRTPDEQTATGSHAVEANDSMPGTKQLVKPDVQDPNAQGKQEGHSVTTYEYAQPWIREWVTERLNVFRENGRDGSVWDLQRIYQDTMTERNKTAVEQSKHELGKQRIETARPASIDTERKPGVDEIAKPDESVPPEESVVPEVGAISEQLHAAQVEKVVEEIGAGPEVTYEYNVAEFFNGFDRQVLKEKNTSKEATEVFQWLDSLDENARNFIYNLLSFEEKSVVECLSNLHYFINNKDIVSSIEPSFTNDKFYKIITGQEKVIFRMLNQEFDMREAFVNFILHNNLSNFIYPNTKFLFYECLRKEINSLFKKVFFVKINKGTINFSMLDDPMVPLGNDIMCGEGPFALGLCQFSPQFFKLYYNACEIMTKCLDKIASDLNFEEIFGEHDIVTECMKIFKANDDKKEKFGGISLKLSRDISDMQDGWFAMKLIAACKGKEGINLIEDSFKYDREGNFPCSVSLREYLKNHKPDDIDSLLSNEEGFTLEKILEKCPEFSALPTTYQIEVLEHWRGEQFTEEEVIRWVFNSPEIFEIAAAYSRGNDTYKNFLITNTVELLRNRLQKNTDCEKYVLAYLRLIHFNEEKLPTNIDFDRGQLREITYFELLDSLEILKKDPPREYLVDSEGLFVTDKELTLEEKIIEFTLFGFHNITSNESALFQSYATGEIDKNNLDIKKAVKFLVEHHDELTLEERKVIANYANGVYDKNPNTKQTVKFLVEHHDELTLEERKVIANYANREYDKNLEAKKTVKFLVEHHDELTLEERKVIANYANGEYDKNPNTKQAVKFLVEHHDVLTPDLREGLASVACGKVEELERSISIATSEISKLEKRLKLLTDERFEVYKEKDSFGIARYFRTDVEGNKVQVKLPEGYEEMEIDGKLYLAKTKDIIEIEKIGKNIELKTGQLKALKEQKKQIEEMQEMVKSLLTPKTPEEQEAEKLLGDKNAKLSQEQRQILENFANRRTQALDCTITDLRGKLKKLEEENDQYIELEEQIKIFENEMKISEENDQKAIAILPSTTFNRFMIGTGAAGALGVAGTVGILYALSLLGKAGSSPVVASSNNGNNDKDDDDKDNNDNAA